MKKRVLLIAVFWLLMSSAYGRVLVDQVGREVKVAEPLQRVVSLAPNLTEISYEVGGGDALVGATRFANVPDAAARLPKVGSYVALDIEKIVSLKPQLCLAIRDGNPKATVDRLEALGIPVYVFDPRSLEEIIDTVERLGSIYRQEARAESLVSGYRQRLARVARQVSGVRNRPGVFSRSMRSRSFRPAPTHSFISC